MDETIIRILREKEEEVQQLKLNLRRSESKCTMLEEVAQEFEEDAKRIRDELTEFKEKVSLRSEGSMRDLRELITRLEGELADSHSAKDLLQNDVHRLEKLLDEERQSRPTDESFHPDTSTTCTSHEEEIKLLREEIEEGVQSRLAMDNKMNMKERELMEANERADDAMQEGNMLRKNLEEARDQLRNLEGELNSVKHNTHFASKGNSMFSEFVDERKKLEKDLKQLFEENLSLRLENRTLLSEIEELSMQKGKGYEQPTRLPCKCSDLQAELYQTRIERDRALQASRSSMITSTDELKRAGLLDVSQKKRMTELRDEAKRHYVENDRLRRAIELLKMDIMNANVDKNTWKEKFEAQSREVDRLKDLLTTLRKKHSALSRPSNASVTSDDIVKMCARPTDVLQTPAASSRAPSSSSLFTASRTSTAKQSLFPPLTPAGALKRPLQEVNPEKKLEELNERENSVRQAEGSINSSVRRKLPPKRPKITFVTNMVKSEVQTVMTMERAKREGEGEGESTESSLERRLRNVTPPDETDEKSNSSNNDDKIIEKVEDEGRENADPSFIMSKERVPADSNLEATVLDETILID